MKVLNLTSISYFFIPYFIVTSLEGEGNRPMPLVFPGWHTQVTQSGVIACLQATQCLFKNLWSCKCSKIRQPLKQFVARVSPWVVLERCFASLKKKTWRKSNCALESCMQITNTFVEYDLDEVLIQSTPYVLITKNKKILCHSKCAW